MSGPDETATEGSAPQPTPIDHLSTQAGYDRWAAIYDTESNPLCVLEEPCVDALAGDVAGRHVVDVGCGTGRHALRFARRGARVTAMDFSSAMLDAARRKPGAEAVHFVQHDLAERFPLADETADVVVCGLVVEHIGDLDHLFAEMRRIVRGGGRVIVSAMHPAMMLRGVTARFVDPQTGRETRPASHAHVISDFVMAAVRAELEIEHLSEHAADAALAARAPRAEKYIGWPLLFMMELSRRG